MESLISNGKVVRGWLGVGIQNLSEDLAKSFNHEGTDGALVGHVDPDGPAGKAGLKQGDIITTLNGEKMKDKLGF
jgi:S1-C subfamily serine protease